MKIGVLVAVLAIVGVVLLSGCSSSGGHSGLPACAKCEVVKTAGTGWCDTCKKGLVNGQEITCPGCYAAKTGGPACPICNR
jgi:hypothetical protein